MIRLLLICALVLSISPAKAVTPDIRLPEWYQLDLILKPAAKSDILNLVVRLHAPLTDVCDVSVSMRLPNGISVTPTELKQPLIRKGDSWEAVFTTGMKPGTSGWVEIAAAARPDISQMEQWLKSVATCTATARLILQAEIQKFTDPIQIGRIFPITMTPELSVLLPREFLFQSLPLGSANRVFVWAPEGEFSLPAPKRALRELRARMQREEWSKAAATARSLAVCIQTASELTFIAPGQRRMTLSKEMIEKAIAASIPALEILAGNYAAAEKALDAQMAESQKQPFGAYLWANLGALHAANNKNTEAREALTKALALFPTWTIIRDRLAQLPPRGEQ